MASNAPNEIVEVDATDETDPNNRVHHHARIREGETNFLTLCGLRMNGKRPDAHLMPCCPLCSLELDMLGRRCV